MSADHAGVFWFSSTDADLKKAGYTAEQIVTYRAMKEVERGAELVDNVRDHISRGDYDQATSSLARLVLQLHGEVTS